MSDEFCAITREWLVVTRVLLMKACRPIIRYVVHRFVLCAISACVCVWISLNSFIHNIRRRNSADDVHFICWSIYTYVLRVFSWYLLMFRLCYFMFVCCFFSSSIRRHQYTYCIRWPIRCPLFMYSPPLMTGDLFLRVRLYTSEMKLRR